LGKLYSQDGDDGKAYCSSGYDGEDITCIYNASAGEISYEKNGVYLGVAFTNVKGKDITPADHTYNDNWATLSALSFAW
jgi:SPRY domain